MNGESEVREQKLRDSYEYLENGNTKRALAEVNKVLKKNPNSQAANALKALILLRSSKISDAFHVIESLMNEYPTDRGILHMMCNFFKEVGQEEKMLNYLTSAAEKFPDNEDVLLNLFFMHVRRCDFNAQQAIARKLLQKKPSDKSLRFTMAVSTMMQGENDSKLAKRMFLPLAERLLEKALKDGIFDSHTELQLYLSILKMQEKYSEALDVLRKADKIDEINEKDYKHDYSNEILELKALLKDWPGVANSAGEMLQNDPDNWTVWKSLMENAFSEEIEIKRRVHEITEMIERFKSQFPKSRGPLLAQLDLSMNLSIRHIVHPCSEETFCKDLIRKYTKLVGEKQICAFDIAYAVPILITKKESRVQFMESLLTDFFSQCASSPLDSANDINLEVCIYRIARTCGVPLKLHDLVSAYQKRARAFDPFTQNGTTESTDSTPKDMCPPDGLLLLAVSELLDPLNTTSTNQHPLGRMFLASHWLSQIGLRHSPANHFLRLRVASLLAPGGGLNCAQLVIRELRSVDVKQILLVSLCHHVIAPGPYLTIWGGTPRQPIVSPAGGAPLRKSQQQGLVDEEITRLADFYHTVVAKTRSMQTETEDWLVGAYRQQTYSQIRDFAQFVQRLKHADGLVLARCEAIYDRVLVLSHSFDDALEKMSITTVELNSVRELLNKIMDCRDFAVVPEFSPREQEPANQVHTFNHLRTWANLRLDMVDLFGHCSRLVMRAVPCIDQLGDLSGGRSDADQPASQLPEASRQDLSDLVSTINEKVKDLFLRASAVVDSNNAFNTGKKFTDLLLSPETIFSNPPPLPPTPLTSFYFHDGGAGIPRDAAFYGRVLNSGLRLITHLVALLLSPTTEPSTETATEDDKTTLGIVDGLCEPLQSLIGVAVPAPSSGSEEGDRVEALPEDVNPSAILLGLGVAVETVSLALLLVSAAVSILRPRRMAYRPFMASKPKKNKKKPQSYEAQDPVPTTKPPQHSSVAVRLDRVADHLHAVCLPRLTMATTQLLSLTCGWAEWCRDRGAGAFNATALAAARALLPIPPTEKDEAFPWYPDATNRASSSLFTEMASNLSEGFANLGDLCVQKLRSLDAIREEVHFNKDETNVENEC